LRPFPHLRDVFVKVDPSDLSSDEFGCVAGVTPDGKLAAQASFLIDRTVWNVIYGSGKFFSRLGGHLVNDLVDIEIKVVTVG